MIRILERHIAKTIILATGLAALVITGVLFLMALLTEFKNIGEGDYTLGQALLYVLFRLPNQIYQFSPMLVLLGSIIGLSTLASHRELAVMRASGFSIKRIMGSVLMAAFLLVLLIGLLGEWIAPNLSYKAEIRKENLQNGGQAVVTASGIWFHVDNNFIHVQNVVGRQLLEGVTRYQFDDQHRLQAAYYAKKLIMENDQWQMIDVVKTNFYDERTKSKAEDKAVWDLKFNSNLLNIGLVEPNELSLPKLTKFARYLERNGLQAAQYRYDFWQRIFQPFASLVMIFLALPFVLGAMSNSTLGWRIMAGILVGFTFFISNAFLGQLSIVYQVPPMLAAALPLLLFLLLGVVLSRRLIRL
ncbi:MAG: LPS export ABC transporter permease LptG [Gammaproteobacteria bacterium]